MNVCVFEKVLAGVLFPFQVNIFLHSGFRSFLVQEGGSEDGNHKY